VKSTRDELDFTLYHSKQKDAEFVSLTEKFKAASSKLESTELEKKASNAKLAQLQSSL
jgi:hypothetical protein